jgi:hypothetical protein
MWLGDSPRDDADPRYRRAAPALYVAVADRGMISAATLPSLGRRGSCTSWVRARAQRQADARAGAR